MSVRDGGGAEKKAEEVQMAVRARRRGHLEDGGVLVAASA